MERVSQEPDGFFSVSLAERGGGECFTIGRGDANTRVDVKYHALHETIQSTYPVSELGALTSAEPDYGSSARAVKRVSAELPRYIRITDFGEDGIESNHEYLAPEPVEWDSELDVDDVLFARSGSVGKTYLHEDSSERAIFAGYCIRFRFDESKASPRFVYWWTKTEAYARWVAAIQRPSVQSNINKEEFKTCPIPLPPVGVQDGLTAEMSAARAERKAKLAEADALMRGVDDFVMDALGIDVSSHDSRRVFAARLSDLTESSLEPFHHAPRLRGFLNALQAHPSATKPLSAYAEINPQTAVSSLLPSDVVGFIPMNAVSDGATGEYEISNRPFSEVSKGYTRFADGDILWAKITPCMQNGKSCLVENLPNGAGAGSTEFHVVRIKARGILPEFVKEFISQRSLRRVAVHAFTGSAGQQRVPADFLANLPFPAVSERRQREIVEAIGESRDTARRLRAEAEEGWQSAKRGFECRLLGGEGAQ